MLLQPGHLVRSEGFQNIQGRLASSPSAPSRSRHWSENVNNSLLERGEEG